MRNLIIILTIIFAFNSCSINKNTSSKKGIKFHKQKYEQALELAMKSNKIIFLDFWASWCGPCKRMDAEVLSQPEIISFFNENFINLKIDADSEDAIIPKINYNITSLPSYVWIKPNGDALVSYKGTTTASNFLVLAKNAVNKFKSE